MNDVDTEKIKESINFWKKLPKKLIQLIVIKRI